MNKLEKLPLFPLGLVLYPDERLPLHIFEQRYKEMTALCLEQGVAFGIVLISEGKMADVGCTARIERVLERHEDGRLDILVGGEARFQVKELYHDQSYLTADVELVEEPEETPERDVQERVITLHMRLLELAGRTVRPSLYQDVLSLSYVIAPNAGLTPDQKQEVLEMASENQRMRYLASHLEGLIRQIEQMEEVRRKVQSNGHL